MFSYCIDNIANIELIEAGNAYLSYFCRIGEPEKGDAWCDRFYEAYLREIERLEANPFIRPVCTVYPFDELDTTYRSFAVGWFTVFYTVEDSSFTVWHVRSSKSDFSSVRTR